MTALVPARLWASLESRLDGTPVDADDIAERASRILSDPKYAEDRRTLLERLLGPVYDWLERMIAFVIEMATRLLQWLVSLLGTDVMSWAGPVIVAVAATAALSILARRRAREVERRATIERILELGTDPAELEARAVAADAAGDHAEAIRLRFVAGLLRLDAAGVIEFYPGLSNGAISERLGDPTFDRLAAQFDSVVYGKHPADRSASEQATNDWTALQGALR